MELFLIRHAQTVANQEGIFLGRLESPLTSQGKDSLVELQNKMRDISLDRVFSSPRQRALVTARVLSIEFEICEELEEMNFGLFEGLSFHQINEKYPEEVDQWLRNEGRYCFPNGESMTSFRTRVQSAIREILLLCDKKGYQRVAIVSHAGVIRTILSYFLSGEDTLHWNFKIENARVSKVSCSDGFFVLESLNG